MKSTNQPKEQTMKTRKIIRRAVTAAVLVVALAGCNPQWGDWSHDQGGVPWGTPVHVSDLPCPPRCP